MPCLAVENLLVNFFFTNKFSTADCFYITVDNLLVNILLKRRDRSINFQLPTAYITVDNLLVNILLNLQS
jgi:hypothetical protein